MRYRDLKLEFFYLRKAFFVYRAGWRYIYNRWFLAAKIKKNQASLERPTTNSDLSVHILTCHRDAVITVWALASWYAASQQIGQLYIHNDGSLISSDTEMLKKCFPSAQLIDSRTVTSVYAERLAAYPVLAEARKSYPHFSFKKLVDPLVVSSASMRLIIDSDVIWFQGPKEVDAAIAEGGHISLMMKNHYQLPLPTSLPGQVPDLLGWVNAGIIMYHIDQLNHDILDNFIKGLGPEHGSDLHFADQFGLGHSLQNLVLLPERVYTIEYPVDISIVVRHYTSPRRPLLYIEAVPRLMLLLHSISR